MDISKMKMLMLKTFEMNTYTPGNVFLIETLEAWSCSRNWLHVQPNKPALLRLSFTAARYRAWVNKAWITGSPTQLPKARRTRS